MQLIKIPSVPAVIARKDALNELPNGRLADVVDLLDVLGHIVLVLFLAHLQPILQLLHPLLQEVDLLLQLVLGEVGVLFD